MLKKFKNTFSIIGVMILVILYEVQQYYSRKTVYTELTNVSEGLKKTPIVGIVYLVVAIATLYFIGNRPFFRGMQIQQQNLFIEKQRKSTGKEVLATIVFGLILFAFIAGFFIIVSI